MPDLVKLTHSSIVVVVTIDENNFVHLVIFGTHFQQKQKHIQQKFTEKKNNSELQEI